MSSMLFSDPLPFKNHFSTTAETLDIELQSGLDEADAFLDDSSSPLAQLWSDSVTHLQPKRPLLLGRQRPSKDYRLRLAANRNCASRDNIQSRKTSKPTTIRDLDFAHHKDQENVPDSSQAIVVSSTAKRVRFSSTDLTCPDFFEVAEPQILAEGDDSSLPPSSPPVAAPIRSLLTNFKPKSILKTSSPAPASSPPATHVEEVGSMLEAVIRQLGAPDLTARADAYQTIIETIAADASNAGVNLVRENAGTIFEHIKRDYGHLEAAPDTSGYVPDDFPTSALRLLLLLVRLPGPTPCLSEQTIETFIEDATTYLKSAVLGLMAIHYLCVLEKIEYKSSYNRSGQLQVLIHVLSRLTFRIDPKKSDKEAASDRRSVRKLRWQIYEHLFSSVPVLMKSKQNLTIWVKQTLPHVFDFSRANRRDQKAAVDSCKQIGVVSGNDSAIRKAIDKFLRADVASDRKEDRPTHRSTTQNTFGERYLSELRTRLESPNDKEAARVPDVWSALTLLCRGGQLQGSWIEENHSRWNRIIKDCLRAKSRVTRSAARAAWCCLIFAVNPDETTERACRDRLREPVDERKFGRKIRDASEGNSARSYGIYCALLYQSLRPDPSKSSKRLDEYWDAYVGNYIGSLATIEYGANVACEVLTSLFKQDKKETWNPQRLTEEIPIRTHELPTLDAKWIRQRADKIAPLVVSLIRTATWELLPGGRTQPIEVTTLQKASSFATNGHRESSQDLTTSNKTFEKRQNEGTGKELWTAFLSAIKESRKSEPMVHQEYRKAVAEVFTAIRKLWLEKENWLDCENDDERFAKQSWIFQNLLLTALDIFEVQFLTEEKYILTPNGTFEPLAFARSTKLNGRVDSIIEHFIDTICTKDVPVKAGDSTSVLSVDIVSVLITRCSAVRTNRQQRLAWLNRFSQSHLSVCTKRLALNANERSFDIGALANGIISGLRSTFSLPDHDSENTTEKALEGPLNDVDYAMATVILSEWFPYLHSADTMQVAYLYNEMESLAIATGHGKAFCTKRILWPIARVIWQDLEESASSPLRTNKALGTFREILPLIDYATYDKKLLYELCAISAQPDDGVDYFTRLLDLALSRSWKQHSDAGSPTPDIALHDSLVVQGLTDFFDTYSSFKVQTILAVQQSLCSFVSAVSANMQAMVLNNVSRSLQFHNDGESRQDSAGQAVTPIGQGRLLSFDMVARMKSSIIAVIRRGVNELPAEAPELRKLLQHPSLQLNEVENLAQSSEELGSSPMSISDGDDPSPPSPLPAVESVEETVVMEVLDTVNASLARGCRQATPDSVLGFDGPDEPRSSPLVESVKRREIRRSKTPLSLGAKLLGLDRDSSPVAARPVRFSLSERLSVQAHQGNSAPYSPPVESIEVTGSNDAIMTGLDDSPVSEATDQELHIRSKQIRKSATVTVEVTPKGLSAAKADAPLPPQTADPAPPNKQTHLANESSNATEEAMVDAPQSLVELDSSSQHFTERITNSTGAENSPRIVSRDSASESSLKRKAADEPDSTPLTKRMSPSIGSKQGVTPTSRKRKAQEEPNGTPSAKRASAERGSASVERSTPGVPKEAGLKKQAQIKKQAEIKTYLADLDLTKQEDVEKVINDYKLIHQKVRGRVSAPSRAQQNQRFKGSVRGGHRVPEPLIEALKTCNAIVSDWTKTYTIEANREGDQLIVCTTCSSNVEDCPQYAFGPVMEGEERVYCVSCFGESTICYCKHRDGRTTTMNPADVGWANWQFHVALKEARPSSLLAKPLQAAPSSQGIKKATPKTTAARKQSAKRSVGTPSQLRKSALAETDSPSQAEVDNQVREELRLSQQPSSRANSIYGEVIPDDTQSKPKPKSRGRPRKSVEKSAARTAVVASTETMLPSSPPDTNAANRTSPSPITDRLLGGLEDAVAAVTRFINGGTGQNGTPGSAARFGQVFMRTVTPLLGVWGMADVEEYLATLHEATRQGHRRQARLEIEEPGQVDENGN